MHLSGRWSVLVAGFLLMSALQAQAAEAAVSPAAAAEAVAPAAAVPTAEAVPALAPVAEPAAEPVAEPTAVVPAPQAVETPASPATVEAAPALTPAIPPAAAADEDPRPAAERGDAAAQYQLGLKLQDEQQLDEARAWFERAGAQDHPAALHQLAQIYDKGLGVAADPHKGFELSLKAARLGLPEAMWDVATGYGAGRAGPRDLLSACTWILRARDHAGPEAPQMAEQVRQVLPYLERALSLEQVASCRKQAAVWPPTSDT
ncbi:MAG: hypothetical protein RJA44_1876, partial [Pseudomonadota bacterium]